MDMRILVTNDDGPYSPGLKILCDSLKDLGQVHVVVPETPKSASGLGITLHKPLRINKISFREMKIFLINGTPSDIIYIALNTLFDKIDIVFSGVNIGDNTSMQVILSSGTVGAAAQAALSNIPALALSVAVESTEQLLHDNNLVASLKRNIRRISKCIIENGFPEGVDVLNINFPDVPSDIFKTTKIARMRYSNIVYERTDPRGQRYYWIYGEPIEPELGTDVYIVHIEKKIAITPIKLNFEEKPLTDFYRFLEYLNNIR